MEVNKPNLSKSLSYTPTPSVYDTTIPKVVITNDEGTPKIRKSYLENQFLVGSEMINRSYNHNANSCTHDSLNSLNDDASFESPVHNSSIGKQNTLPVKGKFGGRPGLIITDECDDHQKDENGRIRRRWRHIERGIGLKNIHKRVEDFRVLHRQKQRRLYKKDG